MPRAVHSRRDLRAGLRRLHRYWKLGLEAKTRYARRLIETALARSKQPVVCWSGGKDSTALLHLILQFRPDIPVVFNDTCVEFPETNRFVRTLASQWNLNLHVTRPNRDETFWRVTAIYGWPLFGKAQALSVERARRTGNIRPGLTQFERELALADVRISCRCCEFVHERPTKRIELQLGADLKFLGMLAAESRGRTRLWVDHGDYYFVKRYFGRGRGIWKANPLSLWTEQDIWGYHRIHQLPFCDLYAMGHTRNGCWPCAMGVRNGQLGRLRRSHPKLFQYLMTRTDFGAELLKARRVLRDRRVGEETAFTREAVSDILARDIEFFDTL